MSESKPNPVPLPPAEIDALARSLRSRVKADPEGVKARLAALSPEDRVDLALRLPPRERLDLLLHSPKPMALVRSLPALEVYLTVREVGPADALPLLALASADQILHLLDLESWRGDRFDPLRCGAWAALLLESGDATLVRFLRNADDEILVLLFAEWIRARPLEIDHEEPVKGHGITESGDERGFVSPDGAHLFAPAIPEHAPAVRRLAEALFRDDPDRYLGILRSAAWDLHSEIEERALRWRTSRLEERGFVPFEEAIEIYAAPKGVSVPEAVVTDAPPPRSLVLAGEARDLLARATDRLPAEERDRFFSNLAALANRALVAEGLDTGDPDSHRRALRKATGHLAIAIEGRGIRDEGDAAALLSSVPPVELFRETHARLAGLQERTRRLLHGGGWGKNGAEALARVDAPLRAKLAGLLQPRPLYCDESAEREPFREFRTLAEVEETRLALDLVERVASFLGEGLGADPAALDAAREGHAESPPRLSTLLLTALAWHVARGELRLAPVPPEVAAALLEVPDPTAALSEFVAACAERLSLDDADREALMRYGRASVERLPRERGDALILA